MKNGEAEKATDFSTAVLQRCLQTLKEFPNYKPITKVEH